MNEHIKKLAENAGFGPKWFERSQDGYPALPYQGILENFAESIIRECVREIETYRIPVGNSAAGEMACEWTYDALKEVRDNIKDHFGIKQ